MVLIGKGSFMEYSVYMRTVLFFNLFFNKFFQINLIFI